MKTTIEITGFPELVLGRAVELGIARSKTDALRIGILALNEKFGLVEHAEKELAGKQGEKGNQEGGKPKTKLELLKNVMKRYSVEQKK